MGEIGAKGLSLAEDVFNSKSPKKKEGCFRRFIRNYISIEF